MLLEYIYLNFTLIELLVSTVVFSTRYAKNIKLNREDLAVDVIDYYNKLKCPQIFTDN